MTSDGVPLPIVVKNEETGAFDLQEGSLKEVLLCPEIANKNVCVVAVAGAFRKGKSFLLDFFLRYLDNMSDNWLADESCPLQGFKWCQGYRRETTGIYIWSKPFIRTASTGEEIAIILMDTQGTFDAESSLKDSTAVFALALLMSSELVYNLSSNIQEDDLMNLQTFVTYGLQACSDTDESSPFQKLLFLVRDWMSPAQLPYGNEGGQKLLAERLEIKPGHSESNKELRRDLLKCFGEINCYLMPHPGVRIQEDIEFDGRLSEIDHKFVEHLGVLVPGLLAPDNLITKKFGGQTLRAKDLFECFKTFIEAFKTEGLVDPATMTEFMAQASSQAALGRAKELYLEAIEDFVRKNLDIEIGHLEVKHENLKLKAMSTFEEKNKLGSRSKRINQQYRQKLENEITKIYELQYRPQATSRAAMQLSLQHYSTAMENHIKDKEPAVLHQILKDHHELEKQNAVTLFLEKNVLGMKNAAIFDEYKALLEEKVDEHLQVKFLPEASSQVARLSGIEQYKQAMNSFFGNDNYTLTVKTLVLEHEHEKQRAVGHFNETNKIGRKNEEAFDQNFQLMKDAIEKLHQTEYIPRVSSQEVSEASKKCYEKAMDKFLEEEEAPTLEQLADWHKEERQKAIAEYQERNVLAHKNSAIFEEYKECLRNFIDALYETKFLPSFSSQSTLSNCESEYKDKMDSLVNDKTANISVNELEDFHDVLKQDAIKKFRTENTFGANNSSISERFLNRLQQTLDELHEVEYIPIVSSRAALDASFERYAEDIRNCSGEKTLSTEHVNAKHKEAKPKAIADYCEINWRGKKNSIVFQKYEDVLVKKIDEERDEQLAVRTACQAAMEESLQVYVGAMKHHLSSSETSSVKEVEAQHAKELSKAISNYQGSCETARKYSAIFEGYNKLLNEKVDEHLQVKFLPEASSQVARLSGIEQYKEAMNSFFGNDNCTLTLATLVREHEHEKQRAAADYNETNEIGRKNEEAFDQNLKLMKDVIENLHQTEYIPRVSSQEVSEASKKSYEMAMDKFLEEEEAPTLEQLATKHEEERRKATTECQERNVLAHKNSAISEEYKECLGNFIDALYEKKFLPRFSSKSTLLSCISEYKGKMDSFIKDESANISLSQLEDYHNVMKQDAIKKYQTENTFGANNFPNFEEVPNRLEQELEKLHELEYMPIVSSRAALNASFELYAKKIRDCSGEKETLSVEYVSEKHKKAKPEAIADYRERNRRAKKNAKIFQEYEDFLVKKIDEERDEQISVRAACQAAMEESLQMYVTAAKDFLHSAQKPSLLEAKIKHKQQLKKAISNYRGYSERAEKSSAVFEGYCKLLEKAIDDVGDKDEEIFRLKNELWKHAERWCVLL